MATRTPATRWPSHPTRHDPAPVRQGIEAVTLREASMGVRLRHPNLVRLLHVYESERQYNFVFEVSARGQRAGSLVAAHMGQGSASRAGAARALRACMHPCGRNPNWLLAGTTPCLHTRMCCGAHQARADALVHVQLCSCDLRTHMSELRQAGARWMGQHQLQSYLRGILSAVDYCHERRILHRYARDLAPMHVAFDPLRWEPIAWLNRLPCCPPPRSRAQMFSLSVPGLWRRVPVIGGHLECCA